MLALTPQGPQIFQATYQLQVIKIDTTSGKSGIDNDLSEFRGGIKTADDLSIVETSDIESLFKVKKRNSAERCEKGAMFASF